MRIKTANTRRRIAMMKRYRFSEWDENVPHACWSRRYYRKEAQQFIKYWAQYRKPGAVYHSCSLHPCYVTELDVEVRNGVYYGGSIYGKSLLDGSEGHGCDLQHCGVYLMEPEEIARYKEAWDREGERGILLVYNGGNEEDADAFLKAWR